MAKYYIMACAAIIFAGVLLSLQIIGGLEATKGGSDYTRASMVVAMGTVALLPVFVHFAWHLSKSLSIALMAGFLFFLGYSLPATVGRTSEVKEMKALSATDAASIKVKIADLEKTLRHAEPARAAECQGAPVVIVPPAWPECRRKTGSVDAFLKSKAELEAKLTGIGSDQLGDVGSETLAWALSPVAVKADVIRKASSLGLALGLECAIWALVWLGSISIGHGNQVRASARKPVQIEAVTEGEQFPTPAELEQLRRLLLSRQFPMTNQEIADEVGISKSEASKRVSDGVAAGLLVRKRIGREVAISATVH